MWNDTDIEKIALAVLDGDDAPGGEALAVADAVDLVDDRHLGIAGQQEIGVQRMRQHALDGAGGRDQRLADHLAAEHALPADLRAAAAKQVHLELLEVEDGEQVVRATEDMEGTLIAGAVIYFRHGEDKAIRRTSDATDVLIGGGGFAGLALAIALRQGLGDPFKVTVADPALGKSHAGDARASAIAAAARRLFETIGVWDKVADGAQPILDMVVTDSKLQDAMRPTFLTFGGEVAPGEPFAHMIENPALVDALVERAKADGVELRADAVTGFEAGADRIDVSFADGDGAIARTSGRRRRRALGDPRGGRHPQHRLGLRPVRHRHHGRARARSSRPRRGAFPAGRAVRDPAAEGQALVDRVDRGQARGRAHRRAAGR